MHRSGDRGIRPLAARIPTARRRFHRFLLRLPLVGRVVRGNNTARFARTFSTLTSSAVPVLEAMRIAGEVVTNLPMRDAVQRCRRACARRRADRPLARRQQDVSADDDPPHLVRRIQRRPRRPCSIARPPTRSARWIRCWAPLVGLLGPLMILIMGGLVLLIVLAMLLPIFQLNQLIA